MWVTNFTGNLRIEFYFEPNTKIDKINIWNFNGKDLSKGVREVDVLRRNKTIWKGVIQKGCNSIKGDYSTKIKIEKEGSITNFDFINLIYKESLENFDFLSSTLNSPSKGLLKSNSINNNNVQNNNISGNNNSSNQNINFNKKNISSKLNNNNITSNKLSSNKVESIKNIFADNNLFQSNCNSNNFPNEIIISEDILRNSISSVGNAKVSFDSLNASSNRNNNFNKLIASVGNNKNSLSNNNKVSLNNLNNIINNKNKNDLISNNVSTHNNNANSNVSNFYNSEFNSNNVTGNQDKNSNYISGNNFNSNSSEININLIKSQSIQIQHSSITHNNLINSENELEYNNNNNNNNNTTNKNDFSKTSKNPKTNINIDKGMQSNSSNSLILVGSGNPYTSLNNNEMKNNNFNSPNNKLNINSLCSNTNSLIENKKIEYLSCKRIKIVLRASYGDNEYIGLTGIQFFDKNEEPINIEKAKTIGALPKDINTVMNNCGDPRIFENVFNLINQTNDDNYMWLTIYNSASPPYIEISYEDFIHISTIKFWNYNKTGDLHRGVKIIDLILDEDYKNQLCITFIFYFLYRFLFNIYN